MALSTSNPPLTSTDLPDLTGTPYRQGALAALNIVHEGLDNPTVFDQVVSHVASGPAPQEFKDGFDQTLRALLQTLSI